MLCYNTVNTNYPFEYWINNEEVDRNDIDLFIMNEEAEVKEKWETNEAKHIMELNLIKPTHGAAKSRPIYSSWLSLD